MAKCNNGEAIACTGKAEKDLLGMCSECFDYEGNRNEHSDTDGDHYGQKYIDNCPDCVLPVIQFTLDIAEFVKVFYSPEPVLNNLFGNRRFAAIEIRTYQLLSK